MKFTDLVLELTKREAKQEQVNIAQMSEVVARLSDILREDFWRALKIFWMLRRKR